MMIHWLSLQLHICIKLQFNRTNSPLIKKPFSCHWDRRGPSLRAPQGERVYLSFTARQSQVIVKKLWVYSSVACMMHCLQRKSSGRLFFFLLCIMFSSLSLDSNDAMLYLRIQKCSLRAFPATTNLKLKTQYESNRLRYASNKNNAMKKIYVLFQDLKLLLWNMKTLDQ